MRRGRGLCPVCTADSNQVFYVPFVDSHSGSGGPSSAPFVHFYTPCLFGAHLEVSSECLLSHWESGVVHHQLWLHGGVSQGPTHAVTYLNIAFFLLLVHPNGPNLLMLNKTHFALWLKINIRIWEIKSVFV